jgi:hypothetical protein
MGRILGPVGVMWIKDLADLRVVGDKRIGGLDT